MKRRKNIKIRHKLYGVYSLALLIPLAVIGSLLIFSARQNLNDYYTQMLTTDNNRVKSLLSEITVQAYEVSKEVCFNNAVQEVLTREYEDSAEFLAAANDYNAKMLPAYSSLEVAQVYIYTDNPTVKDYRQFNSVTDEVAVAEWYQKAMATANAFWASVEVTTSGDVNNNLCLVRRITLAGSPYTAVAVVQVSDAYIRARVDSGSIIDVVSVDDQGIVYSSRSSLYGQKPMVEIDYSEPYYRSSGVVEVDGKQYFSAVSTINLYMTSSKMYVCTLDDSGLADIRNITATWLLVLLLALLVPLVIVTVFSNLFSGRVNLLREEMHKATLQNYDIISDFSGNDELTEAFEDLKIMVRDIKEKDARMYEAELNQRELRNKQQLMEYKVLASQINPHYLYNTLETIRMKALTSGSREVADAIKLLGKTLHYIQENTGNAVAPLQKELDHVDFYLSIQKLRFGDRINYALRVAPEVDTQSITILPLLLQPVVENAVVHGLETVAGPGMITVEVTRTGNALRIDVRDDGSGMTPEQLEAIRQTLASPEQPQSSIALYNIARRIRLRYGEGCGLTVESELGKGTCVSLHLLAE